jgi:CBS domain-containing protein
MVMTWGAAALQRWEKSTGNKIRSSWSIQASLFVLCRASCLPLFLDHCPGIRIAHQSLPLERNFAMPIGDICIREVVTATRDTTVQEAAQLMRENHVGDLVVMQGSNGNRAPVGIVTDRDIVVAVVAPDLDPAVLTLEDIMSPELETALEDQGVFETINQMRAAGVRRLPVVTKAGALVGILSIDDLIQLLAEEMTELAKLISREQRREAHARR